MLGFPGIFNICDPEDVISFCNNRLDQNARTKIINEGKEEGLSKTEELSELLAKGKYIPVLKAIWSEQNKPKRLEWLKSQAPSMHAPLMFEQAIAEFVNNPTNNTLETVSLPLLAAATFRVEQDATCCIDKSAEKGSGSLTFIYEQALTEAIKKYLPDVKKVSSPDACHLKVLEVAKQTQESTSLPNPQWIAHHGLQKMLSNELQLHPEQQWAKLRSDYAAKKIKICEKKLGKTND